jgi:hypothetical protein
MYFRRTGPLDDRRRRVLNDPLLVSTLGSRSRRTRRTSRRKVRVLRSENYGDADFLEDQSRLIDLVPIRISRVLAVLVSGLLFAVGLLALHACSPRLAPLTPSGRLTAFDLDQPACLGTWFSSGVLVLAAFMAVLVYSIRRYRIDDYHGHYHVWLWAALCWLVMSLEQTAPVRQSVADLLIAVTGTRLLGDGSVWWIVVYGFLIGGVGMRLLIDMRSCLASCGLLVGAASSYLLALAIQLDWLSSYALENPVLLRHGAILAGNLLIFYAMTLHARHVLLDAAGLLPRREYPGELLARGAELAEAAEILSSCGRAVRVHPAHSGGRSATTRVADPPQQVTVVLAQPQQSPKAATIATTASSASPSAGRRLTKEERRRLRERLERERREREALGE